MDSASLLAYAGRFSLFTAFLSSLLLTVFGIRAYFRNTPSARQLTYTLFGTTTLAWLGALLVLLAIFIRADYRFFLVWRYVANHLETPFRIAAFWSSQEGSFILWGIALILLTGVTLHWIPAQFRTLYLAGIGLSSAWLASFVLGIRLGSHLIGNSPFLLMREAFAHDVLYSILPDFVPSQGQGLNPLLRSYWMLIHPPALFLGYASFAIPYALVLAGLLTHQWSTLLRPLYRSLLLAMGLLGAGITLGALWAYEALSFGGYWAWDPVENASLLPWLVGLAAIHVSLVWQRRQRYARLAQALILLAYAMVWYASFLTRSGILGDASVHSFTDAGLAGHLTFAILFFLFAPIASIFLGKFFRTRFPSLTQPALTIRHNPHSSEEHVLSREFWLVTGSLILLLSFTQLLIDTSRPVWNALLGTSWAPPADPLTYYTNWQIPFVVFILITAGNALLLRYRKGWLVPFPQVLLVNLAGIGMGAFLSGLMELREPTHWLVTLGASNLLAITLFYALRLGKRSPKQIGVLLGHGGFALLIFGILFSMLGKKTLKDPSSPMGEHLLLWTSQPRTIQGITFLYSGWKEIPPDQRNYQLHVHIAGTSDTIHLSLPVIFQGENITPHPQIIRKPTHDIYVHVASLPLASQPRFREAHLRPGDTLLLGGALLFFERVLPIGKPHTDTFGISAEFLYRTADQTEIFRLRPQLLVIHDSLYHIPDTLHNPQLAIVLLGTTDQQRLRVFVQWMPPTNWVVIRAILFPGMWVVWLGFALVVLSFLIRSATFRASPLPNRTTGQIDLGKDSTLLSKETPNKRQEQLPKPVTT